MKILRIVLLILITSLSIAAQTGPKLTGTIYERFGAVVPLARITAVSSGKTYSAVSNDYGVYVLSLPVALPNTNMAKYDITVESGRGFKRSETKGYVFSGGVPIMRLDIELEIVTSGSSAPIN